MGKVGGAVADVAEAVPGVASLMMEERLTFFALVDASGCASGIHVLLLVAKFLHIDELLKVSDEVNWRASPCSASCEDNDSVAAAFLAAAMMAIHSILCACG